MSSCRETKPKERLDADAVGKRDVLDTLAVAAHTAGTKAGNKNDKETGRNDPLLHKYALGLWFKNGHAPLLLSAAKQFLIIVFTIVKTYL